MTAAIDQSHTSREKRAYAIRRMGLAAQRMLSALTLADEIRAGLWAVAWAKAAGAQFPRRLPDRPIIVGSATTCLAAPIESSTTAADAALALSQCGRRTLCLPVLATAMAGRVRRWRSGRCAH